MNKTLFCYVLLSVILCNKECFAVMKLTIQPMNYEKFEISLQNDDPTVGDLIKAATSFIEKKNNRILHGLPDLQLAFAGNRLDELSWNAKLSEYHITNGSIIQLLTHTFDPFAPVLEKTDSEEKSVPFSEPDFYKIMEECDALYAIKIPERTQTGPWTYSYNGLEARSFSSQLREHLKNIEKIAQGHSEKDLKEVLSAYPNIQKLGEKRDKIFHYQETHELSDDKTFISIWIAASEVGNLDNPPSSYGEGKFTYQSKKKTTIEEIPPLKKKLTALRNALLVLGEKTNELQTKLQELKAQLGS